MIGKVPRELVVRLGWTTTSFGMIQVLRFANNVILARLLSPPLLGLMLIVNSIRTGVELLSDVGINQNIVSNRQGHTPEFYDTAWTITAISGVVLGAFCLPSPASSPASSRSPSSRTIMPVIALTFVFTGLPVGEHRPAPKTGIGRTHRDVRGRRGRHLAGGARRRWRSSLRRSGRSCSAASSPAAPCSLRSYLVIPGVRHRFIIDRASAREIIFFGKWIFLSSIIYFLAMNFDRLYFAKQIPLDLLGVYAIARSMADMLTMLVNRTSNWVIFPHVASMESTAPEVRANLLHSRRTVLLLVAVGLRLLRRRFGRHRPPALRRAIRDCRRMILPLMLLGVWVAILCMVNDSMLLGMARPAYTAIANAAKLADLRHRRADRIPLLGTDGAIVVLNAGEVVRYVVLWLFSRRKHLAFGRDDLALTILFLIAILGARELLMVLGLASGIEGLFPALLPETWAR